VAWTSGKNRQADGTLIVKVRNSHAYTVAFRAETRAQLVRDDLPSLSQTTRMLVGTVVDLPGTLVLPSESTATIRISAFGPGDATGMAADVDMNSYLIDTIFLGIELLVTLSTMGKFHGAPTAEAVRAKAMSTLLELPKCAVAGIALAFDGLAFDAKLLGKLGKAAFDCVGQAADAMQFEGLSLAAGVIGLAVAAIRTAIGGGEMLHDIFTSGSIKYLPAKTELIFTDSRMVTTSSSTTTRPTTSTSTTSTTTSSTTTTTTTTTAPKPQTSWTIDVSATTGWNYTPIPLFKGNSYSIAVYQRDVVGRPGQRSLRWTRGLRVERRRGHLSAVQVRPLSGLRQVARPARRQRPVPHQPRRRLCR